MGNIACTLQAIYHVFYSNFNVLLSPLSSQTILSAVLVIFNHDGCTSGHLLYIKLV